MRIQLLGPLFALFLSSPALAGPEKLDAWESWVLERHPDINCPAIARTDVGRRCAWPGKLVVDVKSSGTEFTQHWEIQSESWLRLPGGKNQWPQQVTIGGQPAHVLDRGGYPTLRVEPGNYSIEGVIRWNRMPQYLLIPGDSGLIELTLHGKSVLQPNLRDDRILLQTGQRSSDAAGKDDAIRIEVFRKLSDGVPPRLDTELRVAVSGKPREILTGQLVPGGVEIIDFNSPLPARVETDGRLRMQARPGEWVLSVRARYTAAQAEFGFHRVDDDWPAQEVWVFAAAPRFRGVTLSGAKAVDPTQLELPENWHDLPTWVLAPDSSLRLTENWRGDATPAANDLQLNRTVWLDFAGGGATVKDVINGTMNRGWRLEVDDDVQLGRVTVNGEPQLVTTLADSAGAGVEIRQRNLQVDAVSRLDAPKHGAATGWQSSFRQVSVLLNLPPGWRLWHASGPDSVGYSWLSQWDLWDLFLCLLIIGSSLKLLGAAGALLGLATLALSYHVAGSPVWGWLLVLVCIPLLKALPSGRFQRIVRNAAYGFIVVLILLAISFSVQQIRRAIYPQLEQAGQIHRYNRGELRATRPDSAELVATVRPPSAAQEMRVLQETAELGDRVSQARQRYQPAANVQTGPGEPKWRWRQVRLQWSGPVNIDDSLSLWLSPPWLSRLLNAVEVVLVWAYLLMLIRAVLVSRSPGSENTLPTAPASAGILAALVLGSALTAAPQQSKADDFPPPHLLEELERRLLEPAGCLPTCAAINRASVELANGRMTVRLRVSAGASIAFPLPLGTGWQPRQVLVDGVASGALARAGNTLQVALQAGDHSLAMEGPVTADSIRLPFELQPHNISLSAPQWEAFGLVDGELPGKSLELRKQEKTVTTETLLPDPVSPFVRIRRHLALDIDWTVSTTVFRIAPVQGAITVSVPLLPGESVVTPGITVTEGAVMATIAANAGSTSWRSVMEPADQIQLTAPQSKSSVEAWLVEASPRWHIGATGLNPVKSASSEGSLASSWMPWPGEALSVTAVRPAPVAGPTTTVESARLELVPGTRSSNLTLNLAIRSSLGGDYPVRLLEPGELQGILLDGKEQILPKDDDVVSVTLHPGLQSVVLEWLLPRGVSLVTSTPTIELGSPVTNIDLVMRVPRSRWALSVHGPDIGPAMLYWGILVVIIGIAIALGEVVRRFKFGIPLNPWHWLLLAIGMSTVNMVGSLFVVAWFFVLEARGRLPMPKKTIHFNLIQLTLIAVTLLALLNLFYTIPQSLLSVPNMQVTGNGSGNYLFQWYQDRSSEMLPQAGMFSVSIQVYRLAMLFWSLWLVFALLRWVRWGWGCFSRDGLWRSAVKETPSDSEAAQ